MNAQTKTDESTDLITVQFPPMPDPVEIGEKLNAAFADIYAKIEREIAGHVPDVSTDKGRKAIASLAHKIARTKTGLDAEAARLVGEQKQIIAAVDAERRQMKEKLDAFKAQARAPLTEWEEVENARIEKAKQIRDHIRSLSVVLVDDTAETVAAKIADLRSMQIGADIFEEYTIDVEMQRDEGLAILAAAAERIRRANEERAELQRLREAEERRLAAEREAAEAAERARLEKETAERAAAERERIAREAEERAIQQAEAKARAEREEIERQKAAAEQAARDAEARERQAREDAERRVEEAKREAAEAERRRTEAAEAERQRLAAEQKAAAERRAANERHRASVNLGAIEAVKKAAKINDAQAESVVLAIADGLIPNVSIEY